LSIEAKFPSAIFSDFDHESDEVEEGKGYIGRPGFLSLGYRLGGLIACHDRKLSCWRPLHFRVKREAMYYGAV
jgi:hypothetical protein